VKKLLMPAPPIKVLAAIAVLALPGAAPAQILQPAPGIAAPRTVVTVPLQDLPISESLGERAGRLWSDLLGTFGLGMGSGHFMRSHSAAVHNQAQLREDFSWLMDIAGFKLKEIDSSIGIIPTLGLTFGQARELTAADREYVERQLERHARRNAGPLALMQRTIVRAVLDASEIGGFAVEKVEVHLFPLPKVKFALAPADAPLGIEAARIMRAIDRLNVRIQTISPHQQGVDIAPPLAPPVLRPAAL
jgi:hypothetical protein